VKEAYLNGFRPSPEPLGPGQEREVPILVAPPQMVTARDRDVLRSLDAARKANPTAPLLWRVQLRRGFVKTPTDDGREVDVSATTVIGVEFTADQIKQR
jgi:hypothetical protein